MNEFSKMTAAVAFWSGTALLITAVFITLFQKTCLAYYFHERDRFAYIFIIPWSKLIQYTLTTGVIGLYLFTGKKNPKTATLLILYFYMHITAPLTSPLPKIFISMRGARTNTALYYNLCFHFITPIKIFAGCFNIQKSF